MARIFNEFGTSYKKLWRYDEAAAGSKREYTACLHKMQNIYFEYCINIQSARNTAADAGKVCCFSELTENVLRV